MNNMLGFELKFKNKTLYLPLEAGFIITRRSIDQEENLSVDVGLYDPLTNNILNWVKEDLHLGDSIEITVKQIEHSSEPLETVDFYEKTNTTKEESDKRTMERYLELKEELKAGGLI